jgi:hypothetical protein
MRRRAPDADTAVQAEEVAVEAAAAAEAAAVAHVAAEVAAEAAAEVAAEAEVQAAQTEMPRVQAEPTGTTGAKTTGAELNRPGGEPRRSPADGEPPA